MELHVTTNGTQIRKRGECFLVCKDGDKSEWSARKVERIVVGPHVMFTSDVAELAIENNVDVVFIRWNGEPLARLWHPGHGSTAAIRRAQLLIAADTMEALTLIKAWTVEKVRNQESFLRELAANRRGENQRLLKSAKEIAATLPQILDLDGEMDMVRSAIMGHEGHASKLYFTALAEVMPTSFRFKGRSRRPAKDPFNALLNYGYGVLYSRVERSLILAGLDPYLGFLHVDRYNKPSLVFDFIEPFRIWIDRPVVRLFTKKQVSKGDFTNRAGQTALEKPAKAQLMEAVNRFLEEKTEFHGKQQMRKNVLQLRAHELAMAIMKGEVCSSGPSMTSPTTREDAN